MLNASLLLCSIFRGTGGLKSCDSLLSRVENNDPILKELIILPMKNFGGTEVERLASSLGTFRFFLSDRWKTLLLAPFLGGVGRKLKRS